MVIKNIRLRNFRNYSNSEYILGDITLLSGRNGVGKTNILEAIYLVSVCRSYRTRRDKEVVAHGEQVARIDVNMLSDAGDGIDMAIVQNGDKKTAFIKEAQTPISLMVGRLPSVIFAPEIMQLPYDSPSKRRRYLDILLSEFKPKYLSNLVQYNKVLKARNRLLERSAYKHIDNKQMVYWDGLLVKLGSEILSSRLEVVGHINKRINNNLKKISTGSGKLLVKYEPAIEDIDRYGEELAARLEMDIRRKSTSVGPHRDDWHFVLDGKDVREVSSRGEIRSIILALKISEIAILKEARNEMPILLLDDVFAELDKKHSNALLSMTSGAQVVITATDAEYVPDSVMSKAKVIKLEGSDT